MLMGSQGFAASSWQCKAHPVEPCFMHRGRLSSQNGIALTIWLVGTTRIVNVDETEIPSFLDRYLELTSPDHSYIYGDFNVCPLAPDKPGHMRPVCVMGAERLVVQSKSDLQRPPFRLLSTWPADQR
jgi:hypothetical protein